MGACGGGLMQLRGIVTTYRMTTRPVPTKASHYVPGVLQPLRALLDGPGAARLAPETRAGIAQACGFFLDLFFAVRLAPAPARLRMPGKCAMQGGGEGRDVAGGRLEGLRMLLLRTACRAWWAR